LYFGFCSSGTEWWFANAVWLGLMEMMLCNGSRTEWGGRGHDAIFGSLVAVVKSQGGGIRVVKETA
jgi:hypothetical protein